MVILGAGGFAKEILQVVESNFASEKIAFYDDRSINLPILLFDKYPILRNKEELLVFFQQNNSNFVIGIGNSKVRAYMIQMAETLGGTLNNAIDKGAHIGTYAQVGNGATILNGANISNTAYIGKAPLVYYNVVVAHDCTVGDFVELSPNATLLGHVTVGAYTQIGANATILPSIGVGKNCIIGAGAVVTKDVPDNTIVAGIPARFLKYNPS